MQPPQNPLLEMARRDPRAAMMLQQQMQQQQDRQWKMQEQQLAWASRWRNLSPGSSRASPIKPRSTQARERVRQVHPQAAAQMPQMYSKEAMEPCSSGGLLSVTWRCGSSTWRRHARPNVKTEPVAETA